MLLFLRKAPLWTNGNRSHNAPYGRQSQTGNPSRQVLARSIRSGLLLITLTIGISIQSVFAQQTIVDKYGQLSVQGNRIVDKNGQAVQLRGMSLYWSQWVPKFYNYNAIKWLRDDWKITVIRAAMAVDNGGYATNPTVEKNKVIAVVDAAISLGIYVIIDFHVHEAQNYKPQALAFFSEMAQRYKDVPNVLYEPWNEPLDVSWADVVKPYHESVISTIRQYDPDNIIICGTSFYSQKVDQAAANPISQPNIAYTLHYYANSHKQFLRNTAQTALNNGIALFVTEYGTTDASGKGVVNEVESKTWWAFLDQNKVSHANWSVSDIPEASSALIATGASANGGWPLSDIKQSGQLVRNELRSKNPLSTTEFAITGVTPVSCQSVAAGVRQISFTPQYNGQTSDPISFSVLNEMAPTTAPGPHSLRVYTDNPTVTLKAQQGNNTTTFSYDWLSVCTSTTPPATSLVITGVTMISCQTLTTGQRRLSFTPQYSGVVSGTAAAPLSFAVANEMMPTTAPGPYTINLYTDNPTIALKAQQGNLQASYSYNWLDVCFNSGARRAAEFTEKLVVTVLGNPVANDYAEVEVQGAANQTLRLQMIDAGGRSVNTTTVESAGAVERARINLSRSSGVYLLRISTPTQHEVIKLVKP